MLLEKIKPELVGILNLTPDSFSDGGKFNQSGLVALKRARKLIEDGAQLIDVGAQSTRPGAANLTWQQEVERLKPFVNELRKSKIRLPLSLDTIHHQTVQWMVDQLGLVILNSVGALHQPELRQLAAKLKLKVILSHLPKSANGDPQAAHTGKLIDDPLQVLRELDATVSLSLAAGIKKDDIVLDPGIGFGKTPECNHQLLSFPEMTDLPVMIGYSKKRFLGENRMEIEPNLEAAEIAIKSGAAYLRVHDVAEHRQLLDSF